MIRWEGRGADDDDDDVDDVDDDDDAGTPPLLMDVACPHSALANSPNWNAQLN